MITVRRERPPRLGEPRAYKWYLRRDFRYRCAYCTIHEAENQGHESFEVDHFRPTVRFPSLRMAYRNLYYAGRICNTWKGPVWPSPGGQRRGERFVDACAEDPEGHWVEGDDGILVGSTPTGHYTIRHANLNRPQLLALRRARRQTERDFREQRCLSEANLAKVAACLDVGNLDEHVRQDLLVIRTALEARRDRLAQLQEARWHPPYDMLPPEKPSRHR